MTQKLSPLAALERISSREPASSDSGRDARLALAHARSSGAVRLEVSPLQAQALALALTDILERQESGKCDLLSDLEEAVLRELAAKLDVARRPRSMETTW